VNVTFTPSGGSAQTFGYVAQADCAKAPGDAWYYDDPNNPTQVFACPQTCDMLKANIGTVNVEFGCARQDVTIN
jgi:hypothetical protein